MTYEEAKSLLKSLQSKKKLLRVKQQQLTEARSDVGISAIDYSIPSVDGCRGTAPAQRYAEHIERLEHEYDRLLTKVFEIEDMIADSLNQLSEVEQVIIIEKYMHGKSWRKIMNEYEYYSEIAIYKVNERAIRKIIKSV